MKKVIHVFSQVVAVLSFVLLLYGCTLPGAIVTKPVTPLSNIDIVYNSVLSFIEDRFIAAPLGYVIPDRNDPLQGTYSTAIKFTRNYGEDSIIYEIAKPRMVRDSESSLWQLAPELEDLVKQELTGGS